MRFISSLVLCATVSCGTDSHSTLAPDASAPTDVEAGKTPDASDTDAAMKSDSAPVTYPDPLAGTKGAALIKNGYTFTEGPVWLGTKLIFSDENGGDTMWTFEPPSTFTVFRMPSNNANGNAIDSMNRLITCEQSNHRVVRADGATITPLASTFMNKSFNSPNDVIVRSDGNIYFTDPDYAVNNANRQPFQGVFRIDTGGAVTLIASDMGEPNGIAFSPDESVLYVDDTVQGHVRAFKMMADGSAASPTNFVSTGTGPDGMAIDDAGNLYVSTVAGVEVYKPDATKIGTIIVPEQPANCSFGGADRKTLYITARTGLYSTNLNVPGKP